MPKIIFFLFLISTSSLFAQKNFIKGYVVTDRCDTLRGYINYKNWEVNPKNIQFKLTEASDNVTNYPAIKLLSFYIQDYNEYYYSKIINVDKSPRGSNLKLVYSDVEFVNFNTIVKDTVFLLLLQKGTINLFYFYDEKPHFYVNKNFDPITELIYQKYILVENDGIKKLRINDMYKDQLKNYMSDCESVLKLTKDISYFNKPLQHIVKTYNECKGLKIINYSKKEDKLIFEIEIVGGISNSMLKFKSSVNGFENLTKSNFSKSINFAAGISFNLVGGRKFKSWSFNNEILYKSYVSKVNYISTDIYGNPLNNTEVKIGGDYLKLNSTLRYQIPLKKIKPYLFVGISNATALHITNEVLILNISTNFKPIEDFRKYEQGILGGIGLSIKRYGIQFRYEISNGMSNYPELNSKVKSTYILFVYKLK